ncbi:MAG: hypothetical protein ABI091_09430 [Ferruginibacter sp.]
MILKQLIFVVIAISLISCAGKNNAVLFDQINSSLSASNKLISGTTKNEYHELESNLLTPVIKRVESWRTISIEIKRLTSTIYNKLDSIKENLMNDKKNLTPLDLSDRIYEFRDNILSLDPDINKTFSNDTDFIRIPKKEDINEIITNHNRDETFTFLTLLQNRVLLIENSVITFCKFRCQPDCILRYDNTSFLIAQNTTHLRTGELLEISAGVGAYSSSANPIIMIKGHSIPNINGISTFKEKVSGQKGKHNIPVKYEYTTEEGHKILDTLNIEYYIED